MRGSRSGFHGGLPHECGAVSLLVHYRFDFHAPTDQPLLPAALLLSASRCLSRWSRCRCLYLCRFLLSHHLISIFASLLCRDPDFRKAHPSYTPLDVVGLTTVFGNGPVEVMTSNALKLLELMGRTGVRQSTQCKSTATFYCCANCLNDCCMAPLRYSGG